MKKSKKILSLLLAVVMIVTVVPLTVFAAMSEDYEYEKLDDGTVMIINYTGHAKNLKIPSEIDGYTVTIIDEYAFCDNVSLKSVTIPNSVTSIRDYAFARCSSLESVEISNSVMYIGSAFRACTSLSEINVSMDNTAYSSVDGVLFNKDKTILICYPEGKADKSYQIPNSVISIDDYAFSACSLLENVSIPDSVTSIGDRSFLWCRSLETVKIGNGVISIENAAFGDCTSLRNVEIGSGVTTIADKAFDDCQSLKSVTIPGNVTEIGLNAFGYYYDDGGYDSCKIPNFTIYGEKGTAAEKYANENGFKFIEGKPDETKPGDIDGDNEINANDAVMVQRYVAGIGTLSAEQLKSADLNNDGIVDEADAIKILRIDAGLEK